MLKLIGTYGFSASLCKYEVQGERDKNTNQYVKIYKPVVEGPNFTLKPTKDRFGVIRYFSADVDISDSEGFNANTGKPLTYYDVIMCIPEACKEEYEMGRIAVVVTEETKADIKKAIKDGFRLDRVNDKHGLLNPKNKEVERPVQKEIILEDILDEDVTGAADLKKTKEDEKEVVKS